jgi:hypothetical protein
VVGTLGVVYPCPPHPCRRVVLALAGHDGATRQELLC